MMRPIDMEIAEKPKEKALVLAFRTELPHGHGMLFPYVSPQERAVWMLNSKCLGMIIVDDKPETIYPCVQLLRDLSPIGLL